MSKKNKKKNSNYQTKTPKQPTATSRSNLLTIVLIVAVLLVSVIGCIFIINRNDKPNQPTAPIVPVDQNPAGNDTDDMAKYLNEKYGMEFTHEFTSAGASVFSAEGLPGLVQVFRREVIQTFDSSIAHLFTDAYADNGYMIVNMKKAAEYYEERISGDFGNCTFLTYIDIIANPSKVTADTTYPQYLNDIANLSIPELIILTDKILSDEEKVAIENDMIALGTPIAVRVFTIEAEEQPQVGPSDIMQLGAGYKDVQYRQIFNANHLLGE